MTINGTTTTTDRRGCFKLRTELGLAPIPFAVEVNGEQLQVPDAVVFDGGVIKLLGSRVVSGRCHPQG